MILNGFFRRSRWGSPKTWNCRRKMFPNPVRFSKVRLAESSSDSSRFTKPPGTHQVPTSFHFSSNTFSWSSWKPKMTQSTDMWGRKVRSPCNRNSLSFFSCDSIRDQISKFAAISQYALPPDQNFAIAYGEHTKNGYHCVTYTHSV